MTSTSLDDFKIEKVLGKGSFGLVYLVTRKKDNKVYALKSVILEKLTEKQQESSVNEVRILASIKHPNVIGYKEAFWDEKTNSLNIVMEYADDGDLQSKINKMKKENGFFNESLIWNYSIQLIQGLKALHDKKIMHRDLKSANIFLIKDKNQCKIGDMNVSKVIKEKLLRTQTGTPYYASPEVWLDKPYSFKSDLWSIGCIIYELCQLKTPFTGENIDDLFINVCMGKAERINKVYSEDLWKMINMLLQVDVDKRVNCDQFLNSELILKKIDEIKKNENFSNNLNKIIYDEEKNLLDTIKFEDIKDIKSHLPTKKNYDGSTAAESFNKNNTIEINNINNYIIDTHKDEEKNENKNKLLIKELRKELESIKYKEEIRKKEKRENLENKLKNQKNNKEKNIIIEKIKQSENKLKAEKNKKNLELLMKNYKLKKNKNKIGIPFDNNKKVKFIKRSAINDLYANNSKLSMVANINTNSIKKNDINEHLNLNQNSERHPKHEKKDNFFDLKFNLNSLKKINKKSQSFSDLPKYIKSSNDIPYNIINKNLSDIILNINNDNINNKNYINLNDRERPKTNILNFLTSINSNNNYEENNYNNIQYNNNNNQLNFKESYNFELNKYKKNKYYNYKGTNSTPDLDQFTRIKLINPRKKDSRKNELSINLNYMSNNLIAYINNNNRYSIEGLTNLKNKNSININSSINSKKNKKIIISTSSKNYFPKKSKPIFDKTNINYCSNKNTFRNLKLNIPIKGNAQRKLTEINLEEKINKINNEINRNKLSSLEKYELDKPGTTIYEIDNENQYLKKNLLIEDKNKYIKKYINFGVGINKRKNSFLNPIKKEVVEKILTGIKPHRANNKYYQYQANKYSINKNKNNYNSLKMINGNSCFNIPIKSSNYFNN